MKRPNPFVVLSTAVRLYSRPLRHRVRGHLRNNLGVRIGPITVAGHCVVLRSPQLSDWSRWHELRIRDQEFIEPFWVSSPHSWAERHTERAWVEEYLHARREARAGRALPLVIEVDGALAGQFNLERIDAWAGSAEGGVWIDSTLTGEGVALAAGYLLAEYAFVVLGLHRLTAPVCVGNASAARSAEQGGMHREGTMVGYLDVGGRRKDHHLWAITAEMWAAQKERISDHAAR
ncbi:GNAT family N-acetyltransferase [Rhodococcus pyridinivorans]|uniref:GNAT family N-acetyltransferase n=1 Tax=Rhodococcus pyridinivorans TaxID=103816 RepID=UPI00207879D7|nr:GNAT family protein [Rhodococcus pyridinivorans]USI91347.1 GNAT family N-acetyltransferase [Rhodococcus pyridinivorans]